MLGRMASFQSPLHTIPRSEYCVGRPFAWGPSHAFLVANTGRSFRGSTASIAKWKWLKASNRCLLASQIKLTVKLIYVVCWSHGMAPDQLTGYLMDP